MAKATKKKASKGAGCLEQIWVMIVDDHPVVRQVFASLIDADAMGYVSKYEAADRIIDAIRTVVAGNLCLSDSTSSKLLRKATGKGEPADADETASLSDRELEVFELLRRDKSINKIAVHLYLSPKTIETYRAHLKDKLGVETSQQLARRAYRWVESTC